LFLLVVTLSLHPVSFSQESEKNTTEGGFTIGPMVFLGDLGGHFGKGTGFLKDLQHGHYQVIDRRFRNCFPSPVAGLPLLPLIMDVSKAMMALSKERAAMKKPVSPVT